jgi:hypothetical protein
VGVLGGPPEVCEVVARNEPLELDAEIFPSGAKASPARRKIRSARSDAPNAVKRASRSCSSGRAWRPSASIVVMSRIAARLSSARATFGKTAIAGEPVILRGDGRCSILRRKGRRRFGSACFEQPGALEVWCGFRAFRRGRSVIKAEATAETG